MAECVCPDVSGYTYNLFIAHYMSDCIYTPIEYASFFIGLSSILCWIVCQAPQFIKNIKEGSAEALSILFIMQWLAGDTFNLIGSFLTHQLVTQQLTAVVFVGMDMMLVSQIFYYRYKSPSINLSKLSHGDTNESVTENSALLGTQSQTPPPSTRYNAIVLPLVAMMSAFSIFQYVSIPGDNDTVSRSGRVLLETEMYCNTPATISEWAETTGLVLGWVSSALYLGSRLPQILKNHKRKSVQGLSPFMFIAAFLGNTTYSVSILLRHHTWSEISASMPWLVGSLGTIGFDLYILFQFFYYQIQEPRKNPSGSPYVFSFDSPGPHKARGPHNQIA